jgi:hypothetical protein
MKVKSNGAHPISNTRRESTGQPARETQTQNTRAIKTDANGLVRCRVCGCTQIDGCPGGCDWIEADLCSVCDEAVTALAKWFLAARRPNFAGLQREHERTRKDLGGFR